MSSRIARVLACALFLGVSANRASAGPIIDFEEFADFEAVTTQLAGLTFSNATVLTAGQSLNELAFPPKSGSRVIFDDGGALRIDFVAPQDALSGYFTYVAPLVIQAFDASGSLLGTLTSALDFNVFDETTGTGGNELLTLAFGSMSYVTITGGAFGGSFTLDDLSTEPSVQSTEPIPEPGTLTLFGLGSLALVRALRARTVRRA